MSQHESGTHPIDDEVDSSGMLGWLVPTFVVAVRNLLVALPSAAIFITLVLTAEYWIPFLPQPRSELTAFIYRVLATILSSAVMVLGYVLLARTEGSPHGVGQVAPVGVIAARLVPMIVIWAAGSWLLGKVLGEILSTSGMQSLLNPMAGWLLQTFGLLNASLIMVWLISPLLVLLTTLSILCNVLCIRTEMSLGEIFAVVFGRVFERLGRLLLPGLVVVALWLLLVRIIFAAGLDLGVILRNPRTVVCVMIVLLVPLALAWWFVLERAWVAEAGVDDAVLEARELAQATPRVTAAEQFAGDRAKLIALRDSGQPDAAAELFAQLVRERPPAVADLKTLLTDLAAQRAALVPQLGPLVAMLARNNRTFEAVELTRYALAHEGAFLADQPDVVPAFAKRLVQTDQTELALRLLATYVRHHRGHEGFLGGGLLLARLLMTHANQPDAARKLLNHLKTVHPQEPQIDMLLRQLG